MIFGHRFCFPMSKPPDNIFYPRNEDSNKGFFKVTVLWLCIDQITVKHFFVVKLTYIEEQFHLNRTLPNRLSEGMLIYVYVHFSLENLNKRYISQIVTLFLLLWYRSFLLKCIGKWACVCIFSKNIPPWRIGKCLK